MLGSEMSSMFRKILFAIDDDEALPAAVPIVAGCARRWDAVVRVLHVHRMDAKSPDAASRRLVKAVVDRLLSAGVSAEGEIRLAHRGENVAALIARTATKAEADLVAIGSHGRSDLGALFLGSVSYAVASGLETPILVLRASSAKSPEPRMVLVAVDGSTGSDEAVTEAADVAATFGASVAVVHVRQMVAVQGTAIIEPEEEARAIVRRAMSAVEARGVPGVGEVIFDHSVVRGIVSAAERHRAHLVVLGSRRPSHVGGLVLGSVAHQVVHRLRCPVLLARRVRVEEPVR